jgi:hypothetical protein
METRRRFKKRYLAFVLVLALGALIGGYVWQAVNAKPGPQVDYRQKLHDLAAGLQGAGPDEWKVFEQSLREADRLSRTADPEDVNAITGFYTGEQSNPAAHHRARELIESFAERGVFEQTAQMGAVQAGVRPLAEGPLHLTLLPYLGEARRVARVQAARMRLSAEREAWDDYAAALEETLASARIIASQTTLIDYLVGMAIEALMIEQLRRDLASGEIDDPDVIERLLAALDRQRLPSIAHAMEGERMFELDIIQRLYTDDGEGDGRLILTRVAELDLGMGPMAPAPLADLSIINVAAPLFPSRARTVADLNRVFDSVIADAGIPVHQRTGSFDADAYVESLPSRQFILRMLTPAIASASQSADRTWTIRAGTELLLRIERYRLERGEAPLSLAELAAADPEANLIDPMTGEPFLYARLTNDPHGRPYVLYAAGADGRDDGGRQAEEGPAEQAFRRDRPGLDYVLNPPPQAPDWDE